MAEPTPVLLGYADRFSVRPGETIRFMVSCEAAQFRASLVRLIHGDQHPDGPGFRQVRISSSVDGTYPGVRQVIAAGSYVRVPGAADFDFAKGLTVQAWIWPTTPTKAGGQAIVSTQRAAEAGGFVLGLAA